MGYLHIENSYRPAIWSEFSRHRTVYVLEKIDGTSANIQYNKGKVSFSSGGASSTMFEDLFDREKLQKIFEQWSGITGNENHIIVYGEAYGGKIQGLSHRYGKDLKFIAFDVKVNDEWLELPYAKLLCDFLGLEFVWHEEIPMNLEILDEYMKKPSVQAERNGMGNQHRTEGIVVRPMVEAVTEYGDRLIMKHKNPEERERRTEVKPGDPEALRILEESKAIANEWVTEKRLEHVLNKLNFGDSLGPKVTGEVIKAMQEDIAREASGEIVLSKAALKEIGTSTGRIFNLYLRSLIEKST